MLQTFFELVKGCVRLCLLYAQFKHAQELFELKQKETTMQAELEGGQTALRNLGSKQHRLDEEDLKQQEILYTQVGHWVSH